MFDSTLLVAYTIKQINKAARKKGRASLSVVLFLLPFDTLPLNYVRVRQITKRILASGNGEYRLPAKTFNQILIKFVPFCANLLLTTYILDVKLAC